jgi:hypothetical protein
MDRISDEERLRIAELLAEGAPVWRLPLSPAARPRMGKCVAICPAPTPHRAHPADR